jgi:predicted RNA binding protein YcfA (HicA-like mRNA interferase family)
MNLSAKDLIKALEANGFEFKRSKGSHCIYYNKETNITVVVPVHGNKDLPKGTFLSILKQAGLSQEDV